MGALFSHALQATLSISVRLVWNCVGNQLSLVLSLCGQWLVETVCVCGWHVLLFYRPLRLYVVDM